MPTFVAYIDPGSGSLIVQALIAGLVAIPFFFRQQIGRLLPRRSRTGNGSHSTPAERSTPVTPASTASATEDDGPSNPPEDSASGIGGMAL